MAERYHLIHSRFAKWTRNIVCRRFFGLVLALGTSLFLSISLFFKSSAGAEESKVPLFGFDFELGTQHLSNLIPHFDIERLESRLRREQSTWNGVIDGAIVDDFVTYPGVLESLPDDDVKRALIDGLSLRSNLIETDVPAPQLILPDYMRPKASPIKKSPVDPTGGRAFESSGTGLELPKGTDWAVLHRRWKALSVEQRSKLVRLRFVPPRVLADVIETRIPAKTKIPSELEVYLRPNADAPAWMQKVSWSFDGIPRDEESVGSELSRQTRRWSVEIALKEPEKSLEVFEATVTEVGKTTGLKTQLEIPEKMRRSDAATHIHFSVPGIDPEKMKRVMLAYKRLQMLRLLDAGDQYDPVLELPLGKRGEMLQNIYDLPIDSKHSLIRKVSGNHYELKEHSQNVKTELREVLALVTDDETSATMKIRQETREILKKNPKILDRIRRTNAYILGDFRDILPHNEVEAAVEGRFRQAMRSTDRAEVWDHIRRFLRDPERTPENWKILERVFDDNPSELALDLLVRQMPFLSHRNDHPAIGLFAKYLRDRPNRINAKSIWALEMLGVLDDGYSHAMLAVIRQKLHQEDVVVRKSALQTLREIALGPEATSVLKSQEVRNELIDLLRSESGKIAELDTADQLLVQAILVRVDPKHQVPPSLLVEAQKAMLSKDPAIRELAIRIDGSSCSTVWKSLNRGL